MLRILGNMRHHSISATVLVIFLLLHATGVGFASPSVLVTMPALSSVEWLPRDNQTLYRIEQGGVRRVELNSSSLNDAPVYISVSPCTEDIHWAIYKGKAGCNNGHLSLVTEYRGPEINTYSMVVSRNERYVLQLSSPEGGAAAVSVRGEPAKPGRIRLRVRSKRRLVTNWDPSPIDPQATSYCVVASHRRNYTSLCAAQYDIIMNRNGYKAKRFNDINRLNQRVERLDKIINEASSEIDNKAWNDWDMFNSYKYNIRYNGAYRRKFSRSTKVTDEDPVIACVGDRTHHLIENLDPSTTYFVSLFGIGQDRRSGVLLASGRVRPRTSVAKRLRQNVPYKIDLKGKSIFYFKATVGSGGGLWLAISTCGGAVDIEVLVRGKRIYSAKHIEPHQNIFVPAPIQSSSIQETSDEGSLQFDSSSSEETRMRYVIKVVASRRERIGGVSLELTASTTRWGINTPELASEDGATVRELRPRRSCRSVDIAFLPAVHHATDVIRYCITAYENGNGDHYDICHLTKKSKSRMQCLSLSQRIPTKVIIQKVTDLKPGKKYAIQVTATSKGNAVPYKTLYVDTNSSCKYD